MKNKQKISFLVATFLGLTTLVPALVNAQSVNAQISGTVNGGQMMQGRGFGGMMRGEGGGRINGRGMMPGAAGKVTAVSGNTITVSGMNGKTITIDATNAVVMKDNATSSVSAIAIGDQVFAQGTLTGTNLVATKIHDGMGGKMNGKGPDMMNGGAMAQLQGNGQPVVAGKITAISGNTVTITNKSNVSYSIDATNAKIIVKNATSSVSGLTTGDMVVTQGTVNGNAVTASTIIDQGVPAPMMQQQNGNGDSQNENNNQQPHGIFGGITSFFSHLFGF